MKKNKSLPVVSFILLTFNGGSGVKNILNSIKRQTYPKNLIDIIVVDDGSTDDSVKIAREYHSRVFIRPNSGPYTNWIFGLHKTKGDFVYYVEQDIILRDSNFIQKMIEPMIDNKNIIASFTKEGFPTKDQSWITRFLSYHPSQCDPLYEYLTPSVESTFITKKENYTLCQFKLTNLPPFARMFYRMKLLRKTPNWSAEKYFDHDFVIQCIKSKYDLFAYIPSAAIIHNHAKSLRHLLAKRVRNLDMHYFPYNDKTEYKWIDITQKREVIKMILWIVYANSLVFPFFRGVIRSIQYKDKVLLMEPIVTVAITDTLLWKFLSSKVGKKIIFRSFRSLFNYG